jgi:hypothetical protein
MCSADYIPSHMRYNFPNITQWWVLALADTSGTAVGTLVGGDVGGLVQYFGGDVRGWSGGGRRTGQFNSAERWQR